MSRIITLILIVALTASCSTKKIIYVAGTLGDCENGASEKCLQVKENQEDEWTVLKNDIEGFEFKDGYLQKIEVKINKIKNASPDGSAFNYKFVQLIYENEIEKSDAMEVPFTQILEQNHDGKWQVNTMIGTDSLAVQPTLFFKDGKVSGNAGCNKYSAAYTLVDNKMTFSLAMATKMYCTNMNIEKAYFDCLSKVKTYKLLGNELTLYDVNGAALLQCSQLEEN